MVFLDKDVSGVYQFVKCSSDLLFGVRTLNKELTENRNDHVVLHYFHATITDVVDVSESVAFVNQKFARSAEVRFNV